MDDAYLDLCKSTGRPAGVAVNADDLKTLPVEVRSMVVADGIALIGDLTYVEAVAESIRRWQEAGR